MTHTLICTRNMDHRRFALLFIAPILFVSASVMLTRICRYPIEKMVSANEFETLDADALTAAPTQPVYDPRLTACCISDADKLRAQLGEECSVVIHPPFVIGGDFSNEELRRWYHRTIHPATRAMQDEYLAHLPTRTIRLLLFRNSDSYDHYCETLFGDRYLSVYGYYRPVERTVMVNVGTGSGSLVHELTHAMMDQDFSSAPPWLQEGLASLHEQAVVLRKQDQLQLCGRVNWRLPRLRQAMLEGRLEPIQSLFTSESLLNEQEALNYARARYFCLYLQSRGVLSLFYQSFRDWGYTQDPTGRKTLQEIFGEKAYGDLHHDFSKWLRELDTDAYST